MIVKLNPMHKGKVMGLCGNYDDKLIDDLVSRGKTYAIMFNSAQRLAFIITLF